MLHVYKKTPSSNHTRTISPPLLSISLRLLSFHSEFISNTKMADPKTRAQLGGGMTATDAWLRKHRLIYTEATRHPFVLTIRDGTVDLSAFRTWLVSFQNPQIRSSKTIDFSTKLESKFKFLRNRNANFSDLSLHSSEVRW